MVVDQQDSFQTVTEDPDTMHRNCQCKISAVVLNYAFFDDDSESSTRAAHGERSHRCC